MNLFNIHNRNTRSTKAGFTLVEMIVSLMIFSIVSVVALSALVKIVSANKKAQTLQSAITNLNFALEAMSREIRVGADYYCQTGITKILESSDDLVNTNVNPDDGSKECGSSEIGTLIAFLSSKKSTDEDPCNFIFAYRLRYDSSAESWLLEKAEQTECGVRIEEDDYSPIVSDAVKITNYNVNISNAERYRYPIIFLEVSGYAGIREKERTYFDVQTAISSRVSSD